jgi:hypothetical protein
MGEDNVYQGTVTAQSAVTARGNKRGIFNGRIAAGKITGDTTDGAKCTLTLGWQKQ